jgi:putative polyhydroxyalkanoate system protein
VEKGIGIGRPPRFSGIIAPGPFFPSREAAMAAIDIRRKHGKSLKDARAAVERVAKAVAKEYGFTHAWDGNTLEFSRSGATGAITVARSEVHIRAELGFLMSALKPVIESEITRKLDAEFGDA